jgi:hypothetical protein
LTARHVFVKRVSAFHGHATILSTDRTLQSSFEIVPLVGRATVSRSVSYQETANCQGEPTDCPQTTGSAKRFLSGTPDAGAAATRPSCADALLGSAVRMTLRVDSLALLLLLPLRGE